MKKKYPIIQGTIILTLAGFASRFIGFFYRIFLSNTIGAEGMGIYQLIFPIYTICHSFTAAAIQTAISKFVAEYVSAKDNSSSKKILYVGTTLSLALSVMVSVILYELSDEIATYVILESRCAPLLRILALSVPLGSIHSCICGYYYGLKKTTTPAISQLCEQIVRVISVYLIYQIITTNGNVPSPAIAVFGIAIGEAASMLYCLSAILIHFGSINISKMKCKSCYKLLVDLLKLSAPLTANRVIINLLVSAEAIYIPNRLHLFGLNVSQALSVYGILTGMALPLVLFPSAITNSVAVMLLPTVAEAHSANQSGIIKKAVNTSLYYSLLLGVISTVIFFIFGDFLGNTIFNSNLAGSFIMTLSFICPFLYITSTLSSILHGLGRTGLSFLFNLVGLGIRIIFVIFIIPIHGIEGYLWGLLISQLIITILYILALKKYLVYKNPVSAMLLK